VLPGRDHGGARVRGFTKVVIAIVDGARGARFVNGSFAAPGIHTNVVNRSAPDLFLV
jgi:hypothetical protein